MNAKAKTTTNTAFLMKGIPERILKFLNPIAPAVATVAVGSPASVQGKVYGVYISTNEDCSSPQQMVDYGPFGKVLELTDSPTLFQAIPTNGTYKCVIVELDDILPFTPDASAVAAWPSQCVEGTTYLSDTYRAGAPSMHDLSGNSIPATGTVASPRPDRQFTFFSTNTAAVIGTGKAQAIADQVMPLANPLVVPGRSTFYVDFRNSIDNSFGTCWPQASGIGFE